MRFHTGMVVVLTAGALLLAAPQKKDSSDAALRAAMDKETVDGDLKAAIEQYKKVIASSGASREVVSKALVRLGMCYERQGSAEARKAYERVVREFADQQEAAGQARARLAAVSATVASGLTIRRVWSGPGVDLNGRISADGRYLSFVDWPNGDVAVRDLITNQNRLLTHLPPEEWVGEAAGALFSRDGKRLAYDFENKDDSYEIRLINVDGSGMRTIHRAAKGQRSEVFDWSPDGKRILARDRLSPLRLYWINVADGAEQTIRNSGWNPRLSPDGHYIVFEDRGPARLHIMASDGSNETLLSSHPDDKKVGGWSPDGKWVVIGSTRASAMGLWAVPVAGGKPQGPPVMLQREIGDLDLYSLGMTSAGAFFYRAFTNISDIYTASMDPTTGRVTSSAVPLPLTRRGSNIAPRWSGDGRRIFYTFAPDVIQHTTRSREYFAFSLDSGVEQPVNLAAGTSGSFCWSSDGKSILKNAPHGRRSDLFRTSVTGESTRLAENLSDSAILSCSGDGKVVSFRDGASTQLKVRNLENGSEMTIYRGDKLNQVTQGPFVSRDGSQVAFVTHQYGSSSWVLVVVPSAGGPTRELVHLNWPLRYVDVTWSPDGRYLYFLKADVNDATPRELFRVPAAGGREESTGLKGADLRDIDISPDGTRVAFSIGAIDQPEVWAIENFLPATK